MYFVNRSEIEETITHIDHLITTVEAAGEVTSSLEKLGVERIVHVIIESILDVGNMMIDGFIMRDPGSYHDIIDILIDERVIPTEEESSYKAVIDLRQMLVQTYLDVDYNHVEKTLHDELHVLKQFSTHIRHYLENELGVANAFSNES